MAGFISNTVQAHIARLNSSSGAWEHLLLKRSEKLRLYPSIWQVITGTIEKGEKAVDCATREIKEETGIIAGEIWTLPFTAHFFDPYKDNINASPVFGTIVDFKSDIQLSKEHSEYKWLESEQCVDILKIPSHIQGVRAFEEYVLKTENRDLFKYGKTNERS